MNIHELREEFCIQKITNKHILPKRKFDLDGKPVGAIMSFKDTRAFEKYLESIDEHHDDASIFVQEADIFNGTHKKISQQSQKK